jgi:hypothetical protein
MQKLSGNNLDKFNKSCITFHQESNKIGFAFFWFFYNFLRILQDSANVALLFDIRFSRQAPVRLRSLTEKPSVCA